MKRSLALLSVVSALLISVFVGAFYTNVKAQDRPVVTKFSPTLYAYSGLQFQSRVNYTNTTNVNQSFQITITVPETGFIPLSLGTFRGQSGRVEENVVVWDIMVMPNMAGEVNLSGLVSVLTETTTVSDFFRVEITGYDVFTVPMQLRPNPTYVILTDISPRAAQKGQQVCWPGQIPSLGGAVFEANGSRFDIDKFEIIENDRFFACLVVPDDVDLRTYQVTFLNRSGRPSNSVSLTVIPFTVNLPFVAK